MSSWFPQPWSEQQRKTLIGLLLFVAVYISMRAVRNRVYVSDPQPLEPLRAAEVEDRINPNTADAHILAALPLIGQKRAEEIVAYRERYSAEHQGQPAFTVAADLMHIRGIGTATIAQMAPHLIFPAPSPTRQPEP